jgi:uncharacterized protein (DUF1778 family)
MVIKKQPKKRLRKYKPVSPKKTGYVVQSLRLSVEDNLLIHEASDIAKFSFNGWAVTKLVEEAKRVIAKAAKKAGNDGNN